MYRQNYINQIFHPRKKSSGHLLFKRYWWLFRYDIKWDCGVVVGSFYRTHVGRSIIIPQVLDHEIWSKVIWHLGRRSGRSSSQWANVDRCILIWWRTQVYNLCNINPFVRIRCTVKNLCPNTNILVSLQDLYVLFICCSAARRYKAINATSPSLHTGSVKITCFSVQLFLTV